MKFTVPGEPVAKGRPRFARAGKFVRTYTPKKSLSYENLVGWYFRASQDFTAFKDFKEADGGYEAPVSLSIVFFFTRPKSRQRVKNRGIVTPRTARPDLDNCIKNVLDGLNKVAFRDDSQVWRIEASKHETDANPRTEIEIIYRKEPKEHAGEDKS